MAAEPTYISESMVQALLDWDRLFIAIELVLADVSGKASSGDSVIIQPTRIIMPILHRNGALLAMPGLSERKKVLACKIVTSFVDNPKRFNVPSIMANIILLDAETGNLKAIIAGTTITEWRTATASAVATRHLRPDGRTRMVLAVLGAGRQGRAHIIAFQHYFKFVKVHLWNRTYENSLKLAKELKDKYAIDIQVFTSVKECTKAADVIVTATYASEPILSYEDVKPTALINAVGAGIRHHCELHRDIYEKSVIYTDSMASAKVELKGLEDEGFEISGEVGEIINGTKQCRSNGLVIFHSLGMAVEDAVSAGLVWEMYMKRESIKCA